jgi:hypothetical protein
MKVFLAIMYTAILVSLPWPVMAVDGHQWQELVKDRKIMYISGVIESWMHEANLVELLKKKAPETTTELGTTFGTFMPCLKDKKPSQRTSSNSWTGMSKSIQSNWAAQWQQSSGPPSMNFAGNSSRGEYPIGLVSTSAIILRSLLSI